jgi:hypothetical protein
VNIRLVHDTGTGGEHEYILVGIRCWEDIDLIKTLLVKDFSANVKEILDGIWSRSVTLEKDRNIFELAYHEDIGIYFRSISNPTENDENLENLIKELIPRIEVSLNIN